MVLPAYFILTSARFARLLLDPSRFFFGPSTGGGYSSHLSPQKFFSVDPTDIQAGDLPTCLSVRVSGLLWALPGGLSKKLGGTPLPFREVLKEAKGRFKKKPFWEFRLGPPASFFVSQTSGPTYPFFGERMQRPCVSQLGERLKTGNGGERQH